MKVSRNIGWEQQRQNEGQQQSALQHMQTPVSANTAIWPSPTIQQQPQPFSPLPQQFSPQPQPPAFPTYPLHNLIPPHLQGSTYYYPLNGTPGYPPAVIQQQPHFPPIVPTPPPQPVFTVQDRPMIPPVYNGVNPNYPGLRVLHQNPPIFCVDNFLTPFECEFLKASAQDSFGPAPVVGKGSGEVSPSRTSSTCYLAREDLPDILRKVQFLTGKPPEHCELPQVGRYLSSQQYMQHYDAFDLATEDGRRFSANGGQRTVTVLIYLNTVERGGATLFPALNFQVQPVIGMALVFFPATVDGYLDKNALHAALPAVDTKYVSQIWIRQTVYSGQPSKRLSQTLGVPFGQETSFLHQQQQQQQPQPQNGLTQIFPSSFSTNTAP